MYIIRLYNNLQLVVAVKGDKCINQEESSVFVQDLNDLHKAINGGLI